MNDDLPPLRAPVFPLPGCVLFPKVLLPLRIFEPRYKLMLKEVLDSAGWLAMGLRRGRRELDDHGNPDVFPVAGVGRLVDYQKAEDETYKIVLVGEHRVRIKGWIQVAPFPIARFESFSEDDLEAEDSESVRDRLRVRVREIVRKSVDSQVLALLDQTMRECDELGALVDALAFHFVRGASEKQQLLETPDAIDREKLLIEILERERGKSEGVGDE